MATPPWTGRTRTRFGGSRGMAGDGRVVMWYTVHCKRGTNGSPGGHVPRITRSVATVCAAIVCAAALPAIAGRSHAQATATDTALPEWARTRWSAVANARSLARSARILPAILHGDFDGDGADDVALLVESVKSHKIGIVFLHHNDPKPYVVGVGTTLGNGGDDFEWADRWKVQTRVQKSGARRADALLLEREGSGSGLIYFAARAYHWRQVGD